MNKQEVEITSKEIRWNFTLLLFKNNLQGNWINPVYSVTGVLIVYPYTWDIWLQHMVQDQRRACSCAGSFRLYIPFKEVLNLGIFLKNPSLSRYSRQKLFAILRNYVNGLCMWIKYFIAFLKYLTSFFILLLV